jgi:hypothetical protein
MRIEGLELRRTGSPSHERCAGAKSQSIPADVDGILGVAIPHHHVSQEEMIDVLQAILLRELTRADQEGKRGSYGHEGAGGSALSSGRVRSFHLMSCEILGFRGSKPALFGCFRATYMT